MFWPVTYEACGDARNVMRSATSVAVPMRSSGVASSTTDRRSSSASTIAVRFVSMKPGDTQFTRISGAYSSAAAIVSEITPAFAAEYGLSKRVGRTPVRDATFTMQPRDSLRNGIAAFVA